MAVLRSCEDIARQSCAMVPRWRLFGVFVIPAFPASLAQHISDLHSKFALGPHHVSKYGRHPTAAAETRRGKKRKKPQGKNIMSASATQGGHNEVTPQRRRQNTSGYRGKLATSSTQASISPCLRTYQSVGGMEVPQRGPGEP